MAKKLDKCPSCLPDSKGAYFSTVYVDSGATMWECHNCGYRKPYVKRKPTGEMTVSQKALVAKLTELGWKVETKLMTRDVWVSATRDLGSAALNLFNGDSLYGTIGVRGKFRLTLQRFGKDVVIDDEIGISVYLNRG